MVILGAGASFDSVHPVSRVRSLDEAPPLADGLLAPRFNSFVAALPECADVVGRLRVEIEKGKGVEQAIDGELARAEGGFPELFGGLIALRFYLQRVIAETTRHWVEGAAGVTNHLALLRHIEYWRRPRDESVLLVTFNYDLLIEEAMERVLGFKATSIEDYTSRVDYRLYKPHGSVNWLHDTVFPASEGTLRQLVARGEEITQDLNMLVTEDRNQIRFDDGISRGRATVPALAVPTSAKRSFVCPAQHLHDLDIRIRDVDRLLIVGWRGGEMHFLHILEERLGPHVLCSIINGPGGGIEVQDHLRKSTRLNRFTVDQQVGLSELVSDFEQVTHDLLG
jgi:hypothetical protein